MRKSTDPCLLCQANPATKTNSHILPHFISTGFLGPKGKRRGFELSSEKFDPKRSKVIQDSPKEHYILCPECEHYLGIVEGQAADTFQHWGDKVASGEFEEYLFVDHLSIVYCNSSNALVLRLLVYSMFWRASISSHVVFRCYTLAPALEASLHAALLSMKSSTPGELLSKLTVNPLPMHPYACMTARTFQDETMNVVAAFQAGNQASLNADKFGFLLYGPGADIVDPFFWEGANNLLPERKLMVFSESAWHTIMVERPAALFAESFRAKGGKVNR